MKPSTTLERVFSKTAKLLLQAFYLAAYRMAAKPRRPRTPQGTPPSLLIIKLDAIGDYILFRNYLQRLRASESFSRSKITLCGNSSWRQLAEYFDASSVDDFIWIERNRFVSNVRYTLRQLQDVNARRFDVALQPTYSRNLADLILIAADAPRKVAFDGDTSNVNRLFMWISNLFVTEVIKSKDAVEFELTRNAEFFHAALGLPSQVTRPFFDDAKVDALQVEVPEGPYVVMFPGAGLRSRRWPARYFAAVARYMRERHGLEIVVAGGPNDRGLGSEVQRGCSEVVDRTGALTLTQMTKLVRGAEVVVSNETMGIHMAVALRTRFVCVSNGTLFGRFLPYPDDMLAGSEYVFPDRMLAPGDAFEDLVEKYGEFSDLDIGTVAPEKVCEAVDRVLRVG